MARADDAAAIAAIYAPHCESASVSFEIVAPSADEMATRIERVTARFPWLVLDEDGAIEGYAYASQHRDRAAYQWSVDAAVYVDAKHRRRSVGRALYTTLFELLRRQGLFKVYAGVTLPNPASTGLHEAMGFRAVGVYRGVGYKLGAWHDVIWYALPLQPERSNPSPPVAVGELVGSPEWRDAVSRGLQQHRPASTL